MISAFGHGGVMRKYIIFLSAFLLVLQYRICVAQQAVVTYIYSDPQNTPLAEADTSGNIVATYDYLPYGVPVPSMDEIPNGPGYTGHVSDPDTGFAYMQARYYDPASGRFFSVDPAGLASGNSSSFNRYSYANNNPILYTDPDGRQSAMDAGVWANEAVMAQQSPQQ